MLSRLRAVLRTPLLAVLLACSAAACGGDDSVGPSGATLVKLSGDGLQGSAGETLYSTLYVLAADAQGLPLAGRTVTFAFTSGGGSVVTPQATTDASAIAQASVVLGPEIGIQVVSVDGRESWVTVVGVVGDVVTVWAARDCSEVRRCVAIADTKLIQIRNDR